MDGQVRMTRRLCTEASETSIETEGGAQVWAREIRQACPEKESPRKGNLLGMCDNAVSVLGSLDLPKIEPMSVVPGMSPAPTAICMFSVTLHLSWFSSTRSSLP